MDRQRLLVAEFRLAPEGLRGSVDVRLSRAGTRWVAEAVVGGRLSTGIGVKPRAALAAAMEPAGPLAVRLLLADLGLLEPSIAIQKAERAMVAG